jgi:protein tyrosine/serine phosphatase
MMKRFLFFFTSLALLSLARPAHPQQPPLAPGMQSAYGERIRVAGIPNAGRINAHLYRGAQPALSSFAELKKLGVSTVVNLRREHTERVAAERQQAEAAGLRFLNIPVGGFSAPSNQQVIEFLSIFRDHPEETVFVHCQYGEDRTGVFVASYRMAIEHWPADQALHEMEAFGFHRRWQHEMGAYVRDFPARMNSAPDLAQFLKTALPPAALSLDR